VALRHVSPPTVEVVAVGRRLMTRAGGEVPAATAWPSRTEARQRTSSVRPTATAGNSGPKASSVRVTPAPLVAVQTKSVVSTSSSGSLAETSQRNTSLTNTGWSRTASTVGGVLPTATASASTKGSVPGRNRRALHPANSSSTTAAPAVTPRARSVVTAGSPRAAAVVSTSTPPTVKTASQAVLRPAGASKVA
jgi:hypothetical protein